MNRTVAVTGASGFVGRHVIAELAARGARTIALGRSSQPENVPQNVEWRRFDPNGPPDPAAFDGADAVVHLAGESVAGRWSAEKKRRIANSRIDGTRTVVESLRALSHRPAVLVSSSAVGYYGDRGDEPLTEGSLPGTDFLAEVCTGWERAARASEALGIRSVCLRTGIAVGTGGALLQMIAPFTFGAGGPLGSGRQFVPWIDARDLASFYCFAIENDALTGAVNAVAPDYATNARLAQAIGAALRRPALAPAPAFALRAALGEFAKTLLQSQLVIPATALDAGFRWEHAQLESSLCDILRGKPGRLYVHSFRANQFVARPLEEVFRFFSDARKSRSDHAAGPCVCDSQYAGKGRTRIDDCLRAPPARNSNSLEDAHRAMGSAFALCRRAAAWTLSPLESHSRVWRARRRRRGRRSRGLRVAVRALRRTRSPHGRPQY